MTYQVLITLNNGDEIQARVEADNQAEALDRVAQEPQVYQFIGEAHSDVKAVDIIPIDPTPESDYMLQEGAMPGTWVATDLNNLMVVRWTQGKFSETHKFTPINELSPLDMATATRRLGDWLVQNHNDKL